MGGANGVALAHLGDAAIALWVRSAHFDQWGLVARATVARRRRSKIGIQTYVRSWGYHGRDASQVCDGGGAIVLAAPVADTVAQRLDKLGESTRDGFDLGAQLATFMLQSRTDDVWKEEEHSTRVLTAMHERGTEFWRTAPTSEASRLQVHPLSMRRVKGTCTAFKLAVRH